MKFLEEFINEVLSSLINTAGGITTAEELTISQTTLNYANSIWDYFMIIGMGMTLIYFLMELNRKLALEGRDLNMKSMFAPFLKLMIAIAILSQGAKIVSALLSFHNGLIELALGSDDDTTSGNPFFVNITMMTEDSFMEKVTGSADTNIGKLLLENSTLFLKFTLLVVFLVVWIVALVCGLVWTYKALTFKIELLFRIAITPIALSDIYSGQHSTAVRWLKGFLSMSIVGLSMIVIPRMGNLISYDFMMETAKSLAENVKEVDVGTSIADIWGFIKGTIALLIVPIAELGCMSAVKQLSKEVIG